LTAKGEFAHVGNAEETQAAFCGLCGTALSGPFCSACGTRADFAPSIRHEGWSALTSEFVTRPRSDGLFSVIVSFLRHPLRTILRLTDDPAYRSHWSLLTACVGTQLTLIYVALPRMYALLFNAPDAANSSAVITNEIVQYAGMAILTPIQYYACRVLGSIRRTPMSYIKLCVLSISYGTLLSIVAALLYFAIIVADMKVGSILELDEVWQALSLLTMAGVLTFVTAAHKRFWGMSWPVATAVTIGAAALSWLVVYPGLTRLLEQAKIGETLASMLG
jgi:hypothetical protein